MITILKGEDAKNFMSHMKSSSSNKLSISERDRIIANFKKLSAISKF